MCCISCRPNRPSRIRKKIPLPGSQEEQVRPVIQAWHYVARGSHMLHRSSQCHLKGHARLHSPRPEAMNSG